VPIDTTNTDKNDQKKIQTTRKTVITGGTNMIWNTSVTKSAEVSIILIAIYISLYLHITRRTYNTDKTART